MTQLANCWKGLALALAASASAHGGTTLIPEKITAIDGALRQRIAIEEKAEGELKMAGLRYEAGTYRVAFQTFVWEADAPLAGMGFKLFRNANNILVGAVQYQIRIFSVGSPEKGAAVGSLLDTYDFTVTSAYGDFAGYLYLKLPVPVALEKGKPYLIEVTPVEKAVKRLTLACSGAGRKSYRAGHGFAATVEALDNPPALMGTPVGNYIFFLTKP